MQNTFLTFPNFLSGLRFLLGFVLVAIARADQHGLFIAVLMFAFLLDLIDGPIARWTHRVSSLGPRIDSMADFSVYTAFLIGAWWLWPEIIRRELVFIVLTGGSVLLPALIGLVKFRRPTSYHTWLVKLAVVCMAPASILLFLQGPAVWFRVASVISALAGAEEILITLLLARPQSDVRSLYHLWCKRRETRAE